MDRSCISERRTIRQCVSREQSAFYTISQFVHAPAILRDHYWSGIVVAINYGRKPQVSKSEDVREPSASASIPSYNPRFIRIIELCNWSRRDSAPTKVYAPIAPHRLQFGSSLIRSAVRAKNLVYRERAEGEPSVYELVKTKNRLFTLFCPYLTTIWLVISSIKSR